MRQHLTFLAVLIAFGACAKTSVVPIAQNQVLISTNAPPICGQAGAYKVASKNAAIETLRRGFDRYVVVNARSDNTTQVISSGPDYATTHTTATQYGNTIVGQSTTNFGGGTPILVGEYKSEMNIMMFKPDDKGYADALDARRELGPDWATLIQSGVKSCN